MKNFVEILRELKIPGIMDNCEDFTEIRKVLCYVNDYVKPLDKIRFRGGNEDYIKEISDRLNRFFYQKNYMDIHSKFDPKYDHQLRKITFFMILNTECDLKHDLKSDKMISHLLDVTPKMPKCLLVNCVWALKLEKYFFEMIEHTPCWFGFEFLNETIEHIKILERYKAIENLKYLFRSIYMSIIRSDYRVKFTAEKKSSFEWINEFLMSTLKKFYVLDPEKNVDLKKLQFFKYLGYTVMYLTETILHCFEYFDKKPEFSIPVEFEIYNLLNEIDQRVDNCCNVYSDLVQECIIKINNTFLNTLGLIGTQITIEQFMYWVEVDLDDDGEMTLQRCVGENIFHITEKINLQFLFEQSVIAQLSNLAIRPRTIKKIMEESTIREIIRKLSKMDSSDPMKSEWLNEFIGRGDLVIDNLECLTIINECLDVITVDGIKKLLITFENEEFDYEDDLKKIIVNAIDHLKSEEEIIDVIDFAISHFDVNVDVVELKDFQTSLIEMFNKFPDKKLDFKLILQNPGSFYAYLFENAIKSKNQKNQMISILVQTKSIASNYFDVHFNKYFETFESLGEADIQNLTEFLYDLYAKEIIDRTEYIRKYLTKEIQSNLVSTEDSDRHDEKLEMLIDVFQLIVKKSRVDHTLVCPLLIIFGQIVDQKRWDLIRYTKSLETIVIGAIECVRHLTKICLGSMTDEEKMWVQTRSEGFKAVTRYYFQKMSLKRTEVALVFDVFLAEGKSIDQEKNTIIAFLCQNLVRCTNKELEWLARNPKLLPHFPEAIQLIAVIVSRASNTNTFNCLRQLVLNYIKIIMTIVMPTTTQVENTIDGRTIFTDLLKIFNKLPEIIYSDIFLLAQQTLFDLIGEDFREDAREQIAKMKDCEGKLILLGKL